MFYMNILESVFLQAEMPTKIKHPKFESSQTPQKRDPHWEEELYFQKYSDQI